MIVNCAGRLREQTTSQVNAQADEVRRNEESQRNQTEQIADELRTSSIRNAETLGAELSAQSRFATSEPSSNNDLPISGGGKTIDRIGNECFQKKDLPLFRFRLKQKTFLLEIF